MTRFASPRAARAPRAVLAALAALVTLAAVTGCGSDDPPPPDTLPPGEVTFAEMAPLVGEAGRGGFRFGAATAATQIEDQNPTTDWWVFTQPTDQGGLGRGHAFVGDASGGYTRALADVQLLRDLGVDSYRFSVEWARVEPQRDVIDEAALQHYSDLIDALLAAGIRPMITLHHFSNPVWVADPRDRDCAAGPSDTNLCGLGHPVGGPMIVEEMEEFAALLAARYGDRVDEWATVNEPINYLLAAYGMGIFPPGKVTLVNLAEQFVPVVRDYLAAHAAMYKAVKAADTVDADGDGQAASVGFTLAVIHWVAARDNVPSEDPRDLAARDRLIYVAHHVFVDSARNGTFDPDLDGVSDEQHPEWAGTLDWLGVQYYARLGVTAKTAFLPVVDLTPCYDPLDFGSCVPPVDPTFCVPTMGYEYWAPGLYHILRDFAARWPDLPFVITEGGLATEVGRRRAENVVRSLEQIERARRDGVDVRGYYHWSLMDNFEWAEGYGPRFGLYRVDYATFARTPTEGADVYAEITAARRLTTAQRASYGGVGPMTPESAQIPPADSPCRKPE